MKHTPGPWRLGKKFLSKVDAYSFLGYSISGQGQAIARVWAGREEGIGDQGNYLANARLIAAAPALLSALQLISSRCIGEAAAIADEAIMQVEEPQSCAAAK